MSFRDRRIGSEDMSSVRPPFPMRSLPYCAYVLLVFLVAFRLDNPTHLAREADAFTLARGLRLLGFVSFAAYAMIAAPSWRTLWLRLWSVPARWITIYLALAAMSSIWSVATLHSVYRAFELIAVFLFIAVFVGRYRKTVELHACLLYLLVPIVAVGLLNGLVGATPEHGDALFRHFKANSMSMAAGLMLLCGLDTYLAKNDIARPSSLLVMLLGAALVLLFQSSMAMLAAYVGTMYLLCKHRPRLVAFVGPALLLGAALLLYQIDDSMAEVIGAAIRKDPKFVRNLTGRVFLWERVLELSTAKPLLGYGFASIRYLILTGDEVRWSGEISQPHSGYLASLLCLGVLGLSVLLCAVISVWRRISSLGDADARLCGAILIFLVLANASESVAGDLYHNLWPVWCAVFCWTANIYAGWDAANNASHVADAFTAHANLTQQVHETSSKEQYNVHTPR